MQEFKEENTVQEMKPHRLYPARLYKVGPMKKTELAVNPYWPLRDDISITDSLIFLDAVLWYLERQHLAANPQMAIWCRKMQATS